MAPRGRRGFPAPRLRQQESTQKQIPEGEEGRRKWGGALPRGSPSRPHDSLLQGSSRSTSSSWELK